MNIECLNLDDIKIIHETGIRHDGGSLGYFPQTESKIESILSQQYECFGHDEYPSIYDKSAMLLYFFTKGHCFVDGNKRVGLGSMIQMLQINGYNEIPNAEDDWYKFTYKVADSKYRNNDIRRYIRFISRFLRSRFIRL